MPEKVAEKIASDGKILKATNAYITESNSAKMSRLRQNEINRRAYDNEQDYSYKIEGQSREFIPKTFNTVEQFSALIKKALTAFGDYFTVKGPAGAPLSDESLKELAKCFLDNLPDMGTTISMGERFGDGTKVGLLEAEMVFKVFGERHKVTKKQAKDGDLKDKELNPWRLQVQLIKNEHYHRDPSGKGLYRGHRVEEDLHVVQRRADEGMYDKATVAMLKQSYEMPRDGQQRKTDDENSETPQFRKKVVIDEMWGTILDVDGAVLHERVFWTVANERYVLRSPQPFPFWHGEDPFVEIPIIRKPFSVLHKALYDQVVPLNNALNELFNLMLDGGLASVWGVKQLRMDYLEDPRQAADGIPQGTTLLISENAPDGVKAMEQLSEGQIPPEALSMYSILDREVNNSALSNEVRQGILPAKAVKATEVVEAMQSSNTLLDSITMDIEKRLNKLIHKAILTILQNADDLSADELANHLTTRELFALAKMTPQERYKMLSGCKVEVFGLTATLNRGRDFQKLMAILQIGTQNPALLPAFQRRISPEKLLNRLFVLSNLNMRDIERDEEELQNMPTDTAIQNNLINGQGGSPTSPTGEAGLQSDITQNTNPTGGL